MDLSREQIEELETALTAMAELDPSLVPEAASELADLLGRILDDLEAD